jgi:hypothetical protein
MVNTRSQKARQEQPSCLAASPGANTPRRVVRSRQGNAGVIMSTGVGSPSIIIALGSPLDRFAVRKCSDRRCKTCPNFSISKTFKSNVTHKTYKIVNPTGEDLNCHSQNIIYLLFCSICGIQYVGETAYPMHLRMNQHRTSKCGCEHIIAHATDICPGHNFTYQIIEKLPGTGYVDGKLDPNMSKLRKEHEDEWIKKLRTIYPYGMNEKASGKETDSQILHSAVGKMFPPLPRSGNRPIRSRANKNNRNPPSSSADFFTTFDSFFPSDIKNSFNNIRIILNCCKKKLLKEIAYNILERENFVYIDSREQWYHYILDVIETRLWKNVTPPEKTSYRKNPCIVHFVNKGLNKLGLSKIFQSEDVVNSLPPDLQGEKDIPFPSYKLDAPIRSKILNYNDAVNSLQIDIDEDVSVVHNLPSCDCSSSSFCDPHHHHIVTGDLRIIENDKLRRLFSKGPNYREAKQINLKKCKESIIHALDDTILNLSAKYSIDCQLFSNWKNLVLSKVDSRINSIRITPQRTKPVLQDPVVRAHLDDVHKKFVIVPIDKAANNVAIICKRFYLSSILQELGVPGNTSPTYELVNRSAESIIETNIMLVQSKLGEALDESSQTLPSIYWMPKMHYTPCKKRFIIASSRCSTKPISKIVSKIFKHIFDQIQSFHEKSYFYKNYNKFWVLQNSFPLLKTLDEINLKRKAKEISTFDFSTLYTKLPHDDLIRVLHKLIDFAFDGGKFKSKGNRKYLTIFNSYCYWTKLSKGYNSFTRNGIKFLVTHLIRECYFQFSNLVLRQSIGIPMGIDPAPFWANLYLHSYEESHVTSLIKSDPASARRYRYASRFIDDQCNLNDAGQFKNSCSNIYPPELQVKCEHEGIHATFLELDISVKDDIFVYKLFDKRDSFPFFIVRMPDLSGNIPDHVFYGSVMSEFLRIARATLLYPDFVSKAKELFSRMVNQCGEKNMILLQLKKAIINHDAAFQSFRKSVQQIVSDIDN